MKNSIYYYNNNINNINKGNNSINKMMKYSNLKEDKNKIISLNKNKNNIIKNKKSNTTKSSPLNFHNKLLKTTYKTMLNKYYNNNNNLKINNNISINSNNKNIIEYNTPTVIFHINSNNYLDYNKNIVIKKNIDKNHKGNISMNYNINNIKKKQNIYNKLNYNSNVNNINNSFHNSVLISKEKKSKNKSSKNNLKKNYINNNKNINISKINNNNSFYNHNHINKASQINLNYINNILNKLKNFKTTPVTSKHSPEHSSESGNIKSKNIIDINNNNKNKSTIKIKKIILPSKLNNYKNNYKSILNNYCIYSELNNNKSNKYNKTNKIKYNYISNNINFNKYNIGKLSNSYNNNFSASSTIYVSNNNNISNYFTHQPKSHHINNIYNNNYNNDFKIKSSMTTKKNIRNYFKNNISLSYNLFPITSNYNKTVKNLHKKTLKNLMNKRNGKSGQLSFNYKNNNKHNKSYSLLKYTPSKIDNLFKNYKYNIYINRKNHYYIKSYKKLSDDKKHSTSLTKSETKTHNKNNITSNNNTNNNINNNINNNNIDNKNKNNNESTFRDILDSNYFQSESISLSNYIKNFYKNNNNYPKTTINFYKIGRCIGHGAFGKVNIALHVLSGHIVAIKSFNKKNYFYNKNQNLLKNEIKIMKKIREIKNIVTLYETIDSKKYFFIVMENVVGVNLLTLINKMTVINENTCKYIFKQLILILLELKKNNIAHRDIKPDNILIDLQGRVKLCDFGISKIFKINHNNNKICNDIVGTPAFIAPEILNCIENENIYYDPFQTEIWSSGVVLYSMLTGIFPFRGVNEKELNNNIKSANFPQLNKNIISEDAIDLINKMLEINPDKRIKINEILQHPYLTNDINNNNIFLFTNAEKIIYGKLLMDYRKNKENFYYENFTYKNIETEFELENRNINTCSIIITPYNSSIKKYYNDDDDFFDIKIEDKIMRFLPKINELNRQYEMKFNKYVDQGYIRDNNIVINDINYNNNLMKNSLNIIHNSLNNSVNSINNHENNNKDNNKNIINNNKENKELNKIDNENKNNNSYNNNNEINNIKDIKKKDNKKINNDIVKYVEEFGYDEDFIVNSLLNNELNHAVATYYLKYNLLNNNN